MLSRSILVFILLWCFLSLPAQCPEGIVHLHSDESIQAFAKNYPNCTQLDSSLIIGPLKTMSTTRITDLSPLSKIKHINGSLEVIGNPWLESVDPLQGIETISGDFRIRGIAVGGDYTFNSELLKVGGFLSIHNVGRYNSIEFVFPKLLKVGNLVLFGDQFNYDMFPALWKVDDSVNNSVNKVAFDGVAFKSLTEANSISLHFREDERMAMYPKLKKVEHLHIRGVVTKPQYLNKIDCNNLYIYGNVQAPIQGLEHTDTLHKFLVYNMTNAIAQSLPNLKKITLFKLSEVQADFDPSLLSLNKVRSLLTFSASANMVLQSIDSVRIWNIEELKEDLNLGIVPADLKISELRIRNVRTKRIIDTIPFKLDHLYLIENYYAILADLHVNKPLKKLIISSNNKLISIEKSFFLWEPDPIVSIIANPTLGYANFKGLCPLLKDHKIFEVLSNHESLSKESLIKTCQKE